MRGLVKRQQLELQNKDTLNYLLSMYILSGIVGKPIKEPLLKDNGGIEQDKAKVQYENNKANFLHRMQKINDTFKRKEENDA